ncbi:MAG: FimB/Mfa2 family fimbrial subunit [Parabacteroides sp.]|nr:FimB/Mfa2 family fimbrial subunit [Parabacteroides sp.]
MNKLGKCIQATCVGMVILLTSCIKDGADICESYIRFVYDYNMEYEDLFHKQASKINLYLFDQEGVFIQELKDDTGADGTFPRGYKMPLPDGLEGPTQFVAWSGLYDEYYQTPTMIPGHSTLDDLKIALNKQEGNIQDTELPHLWHSQLVGSAAKNVTYNNDTITMSLVKNTNSIRIVLQSFDDDVAVDIENFDIKVKSVNGSYDHLNNTVDQNTWTYLPHVSKNDEGTGAAVVELSTLRLLADRQNRLTVFYEPANSMVLDIDLNKYLNALRLEKYSDMPLQEYLDRESEYGIIIFLTKTEGSQPGTTNWLSAAIQINEWYVRTQETEGL